jgi:hypothetical protein
MIRSLAFGGKKEPAGAGMSGEQRLEIQVPPEGNQGPIIQAGTAKVLVIKEKSQRFHQVQAAPGGGTETGDVPCVLRDLRLVEDNVEHDRLLLRLVFWVSMVRYGCVYLRALAKSKTIFSSPFCPISLWRASLWLVKK